MGLFGNKDHYYERVELAKKMAHNANDANVEIRDLMESFNASERRFDNLAEDMMEFSQKILHKLNEEEMEELTKLTEKVVEINKIHNSTIRKVIEISDNQNERAKDAIEHYSRIKG
ncbi:hypothetical protein [Salegentibacter sp. UBA1130]|uniref:hypothetical protein n=1 Tax=Salegentibacter sp. UBA1130 TaxID=1947451 RepID=UPI00257EE932|nr:hypothetical protein [Salegentibacter sp. UBA1130]